MAHVMKPEQTRQEQFINYAAKLQERLQSGLLSELQPLNQWVVWRGEIEDGKNKKVPYNPHYPLAKASVKIPKSWGSLQEALTALETGNYSGIGFMLTPPLVMVDLDHSFDKQTRTITNPQALEIVQKLHSYTELSPSGTGLHILAYGVLPGKGIHTGIEIYGQDRFTTITTNHIADTPTPIEHRLELVTALYHRFAPPSVDEKEYQNTRGGVGNGNALTELPPEAANDPLLQELLRGGISGFQSQSSADFVLIMKLLHWTGDNIELTRRLFLASPLGQREKAKRKTGETTYVDMTIYNVLRKRRNLPMRR
jgi:primase-polymerase (primpol)-like protein